MNVSKTAQTSIEAAIESLTSIEAAIESLTKSAKKEGSFSNHDRLFVEHIATVIGQLLADEKIEKYRGDKDSRTDMTVSIRPHPTPDPEPELWGNTHQIRVNPGGIWIPADSLTDALAQIQEEILEIIELGRLAQNADDRHLREIAD